jgi:hypothetical protein
VNLGSVPRLLPRELLKPGDADGLDLCSVSKEYAQRPRARAVGSHPRRGGSPHLVEAHDIGNPSPPDLGSADRDWR